MDDNNKKTIKEIIANSWMLEIPYYQRSYVWDEEQWGRFADDLEALSDPAAGSYFMGAVILKSKESPDNLPTRVLVDGQQRMTTLFIYMKVLSLKTGKPGVFNDFMLSNDDDEDNRVVALRHNRFDREAFEKIVYLDKLEDLALDGKGKVDKKAHRLYRLYEYFRERIDVAKVSSFEIKKKMWFVQIIVSEKEDEQQIFDAINSLGVRLTTAELLKNYFFDENNEADYRKLWLPTFEESGGKDLKEYWDCEITSGGSRNQLSNLFFAAFINIIIRDGRFAISAEDKLRLGRWDRLFVSYKDFAEKIYRNDKLALVKEIRAAAELFRENFNPGVRDDEGAVNSVFDRINLMIFGMGFSVIIPYAMRVFANVHDRGEQERIFTLLEAYLMRRLVCRSETRGYYKLFYDTLLSDRYMTAAGLEEFLKSREGEAVSESPSNDDVEYAVLNRGRANKQNTAILFMLECAKSSSLDGTCLKAFKVYSLEHLMPREWRKNWVFDGDGAKRDRALGMLGNMAIIPGGLNSRVSNAAWEVKKRGSENRPGLKCYVGGLRTLQGWLDEPAWDEEAIQKRGRFLAGWINEVWPRV